MGQVGQEGLGKIRDQVIGHSVTLESTRAIYPLGMTHGSRVAGLGDRAPSRLVRQFEVDHA